MIVTLVTIVLIVTLATLTIVTLVTIAILTLEYEATDSNFDYFFRQGTGLGQLQRRIPR